MSAPAELAFGMTLREIYAMTGPWDPTGGGDPEAPMTIAEMALMREISETLQMLLAILEKPLTAQPRHPGLYVIHGGRP